jgi:hypothetical protein
MYLDMTLLAAWVVTRKTEARRVSRMEAEMPNLVSPNNIPHAPERSLMATPHADFQAKRCPGGPGNPKTVGFGCETLPLTLDPAEESRPLAPARATNQHAG